MLAARLYTEYDILCQVPLTFLVALGTKLLLRLSQLYIKDCYPVARSRPGSFETSRVRNRSYSLSQKEMDIARRRNYVYCMQGVDGMPLIVALRLNLSLFRFLWRGDSSAQDKGRQKDLIDYGERSYDRSISEKTSGAVFL